MTEPDRVAAFVDDLLARARIPSRRERDDLRRELLTHFDDAVRTRGSIDSALAEFGLGDDIASRLRVVYRTERLIAHTVRIAVGLTLSLVVALGIQVAVSRPAAFRSMAGLAAAIVLVLVLWRELLGRRLKLPTATARVGCWLAGFLGLLAWEYGIHHHAGRPLGVLRAAGLAGTFTAVAASTTVIMAGIDRAFKTRVHSREV